MQGKPEPGPCRVSAGRASGRTAGSCGRGRHRGGGRPGPWFEKHVCGARGGEPGGGTVTARGGAALGSKVQAPGPRAAFRESAKKTV